MNLPSVKGYVCVSDISNVCICWFDNPNSKSHKLKYVYYLKHWYVHELLLQVYQHNGQLQSFGADCWLQTAFHLQSSSYLYQRRLGWFLQLANLRSAKTRELLHNQHNCITVYKSKIHVWKYIMNKIEYIIKYKWIRI